MGVTRAASTTATGGLVEELKAQGQDKGEDAFDKRPAIAKQLHVGGFILEVDGDGTVYARRFGRCAHVFIVQEFPFCGWPEVPVAQG